MVLTFAADYTCAGHWTLAAQAAGMRPAWHRSPFPLAEKILAQNWPDLPLVKGAHASAAEAEIHGGSPPCIGFTRSNPNRHAQEADRLYVLDFARRVAAARPEVSVMEMCLGWRDGFPEREQYSKILHRAGYVTAEYTLNAWNLGGTQRRQRAYVIATPEGSRSFDDLKIREHQGADPVAIVEAVKDPGWYFVPDGVTKGPFGAALRWESRRIRRGEPCYVITRRASHMIYHHRQKRGLGVNELAAIMGFPPHSEDPRPPKTFRMPQNTTALALIGPGVDVRATANLLRDLKRWVG